MKEIKAFVHRNRVADIVHVLRNAGYCSGVCNLSVVDVTGTLQALDTQEQGFRSNWARRRLPRSNWNWCVMTSTPMKRCESSARTAAPARRRRAGSM